MCCVTVVQSRRQEGKDTKMLSQWKGRRGLLCVFIYMDTLTYMYSHQAHISIYMRMCMYVCVCYVRAHLQRERVVMFINSSSIFKTPFFGEQYVNPSGFKSKEKMFLYSLHACPCFAHFTRDTNGNVTKDYKNPHN